MLWALHDEAGFLQGLARPLSQQLFNKTVNRHLSARYNGLENLLQGSPRDYHGRVSSTLGFPVPGCLARDHPQQTITGLAALISTAFDPVEF